MFDFGLGSTELLLVAIVALIVIGPKDLPRLLRTMGQYMRKIQGMAREFQTHLNEAAKEAGVDDVKKEVKGMTNFTVTADLDKQGAEIKRAIESGAPKPPATPPNGADAGKPDGSERKDGPARIEAAKPSAAAEATTAAKARPKATATAKPAGASKPKTARPKAEVKPKPALKPKSKPRQKTDRPREAVKS
jgi:sec-independent protein translocase protein TatB